MCRGGEDAGGEVGTRAWRGGVSAYGSDLADGHDRRGGSGHARELNSIVRRRSNVRISEPELLDRKWVEAWRINWQ